MSFSNISWIIASFFYINRDILGLYTLKSQTIEHKVANLIYEGQFFERLFDY